MSRIANVIRRGQGKKSLLRVWAGIWLVVLAVLPAPLLAQTTGEPRSFQQWGQGDLTARTIRGTLSYYFPLPAGQVPVAGSRLDLVFSHSPLLNDELSTLTVAVNGESRASVFLTAANADRGEVAVPLPIVAPDDPQPPAGYFVEVQFYLRLTDEVCEAADNPALWATVHKESTLHLVLAPAAAPPGLEALDRYFAPRAAADELPLLALSESPTPEELQAAGLAAFQIGRWAASIGADAPLSVTQALADLPEDRSVVLVAAGSSLPDDFSWGELGWNGTEFVVGDAAVPAGEGVVALDGSGQPRLLIGGDSAAVVHAAQALALPGPRAVLTGTVARVTGAALADLPGPTTWAAGAASFAQLGVTAPRRITGPGDHVVDFYFQRPPGWDLTDEGQLELVLDTTPTGADAVSWVTAEINSYVVESRELLPRGAEGGGRYVFDLPGALLSSDLNSQPVRDLALRLRFHLDLPHAECASLDVDKAAVTLLPTSAWILPHRVSTTPDLGRFPWPLLASGVDAGWPLAVVLPDQPTPGELHAGLQLMAALGRWSTGAALPLPELRTAGSVAATDQEAYAWIALGDAQRNPIAAAILAQAPGGDSLLAIAAAPVASETPTAYLQLADSPWNGDRAALVLTGNSEAALLVGAQALADADTLGELRGQVAAVVAPRSVQVLQDARPAAVAEALAPEVVLPLLQRTPPWQVVGAVVLGAVVALLAIYLATRLRRRPVG